VVDGKYVINKWRIADLILAKVPKKLVKEMSDMTNFSSNFLIQCDVPYCIICVSSRSKLE